MIHISQGHEEAIGVEVLVKSLLMIPTEDLKFINFHCFKDVLIKNLDFLNIEYEIGPDFFQINDKIISTKFLNKSNSSQTLTSLESAIKDCSGMDILVTLPSSKDQFLKDNEHNSGHTEYFRKVYHSDNISMAFIGPINNALLLTDHIPLKDVSKSITEDLIITKVSNVLDSIGSMRNIHRVLFSGINPHCGEQGLMGDEEKHIENSLSYLGDKYPHISFVGPISGDTIQFLPSNHSDLFVYASHDQGLAPFKTINGLLGINTTFGLPFLRLSPDHGTAFYLYGKNEANYQGMLYVLQEAIKLHY